MKQSLWGVILLGALACTAGAAAGPFVDPLLRPAEPSRLAASSQLTAVTLVGNRLVAVGQRGRILVANDAATAVRQVPVPVAVDLVAVRFANAQVGLAVGHDGVILRTADGGATWRAVFDGRKVAAALQRDASPQGRSQDSTQDGATTPTAANALLSEVNTAGIYDKPLLDICFIDARQVLVAGAYGLLLRSLDGGVSWTSLFHTVPNPDGNHLYGLLKRGAFVYMVGERGLIRRLNIASGVIEPVASPYKGTLFGAVANADALYIFGLRGHVFKSRDDGATWEPLETGTTASITAGDVLADGQVVLVTQGGQLLLERPGKEADKPGFTALRGLRPMPYAGVTALDDKRVAVVGLRGFQIEPIRQGRP